MLDCRSILPRELKLRGCGLTVFLIQCSTACSVVAADAAIANQVSLALCEVMPCTPMTLGKAKAKILADAEALTHVHPTVRNHDSLRAVRDPGGECLVQIIAPPATGKEKLAKSLPLVSVCIVEATNAQYVAFFSSLLGSPARRVLLVHDDTEASEAIPLINNGLLHAVVRRDDPDFEIALKGLAKKHDDEFKQGLLSPFTAHLAKSATGYLDDPLIAQQIQQSAAKLGADEVYLRLEPPGIVLRKDSTPIAFLFICSEDYAQGVQEIATVETDEAPQTHPGFSEDRADIQRLGKLIRTSKKLGRKSKWFYREVHAADPAHGLFEWLIGDRHFS